MAASTTTSRKLTDAQTKMGTLRRDRAVRVPNSAVSAPDARIKDAICDIHQKVHHDEHGCGHEDAGLHDRIVPVIDGLDCQSPDSRPGEDGFRDDRTSQEVPELEPYDRDNRDG